MRFLKRFAPGHVLLLAKVLKQRHSTLTMPFRRTQQQMIYGIDYFQELPEKHKMHAETISATKDHAYAGPYEPDCRLM